MLSKIAVVTSVSGGSILNGVLASIWSRLRVGPDGVFENFEAEVALPLRRFCGKDLRTPVLFGTRLNPATWPKLMRNLGAVPAEFLAKGYEPLYGRALLWGLPGPGPGVPHFVFCATSVQTGAAWCFFNGPDAKMGDYYTGYFSARRQADGSGCCIIGFSAWVCSF